MPAPLPPQRPSTPLALTWTPEGNAFDVEPLSARTGDTAPEHDLVVSSRQKPPGTTGRLLSDPVTVTAPYLAVRLAGGDYEYMTCLNVLVGEEVVASETGHRQEIPRERTLDLSALLGRQVRLEIVDRAHGDWGWIQVEAMRFETTPSAPSALMTRPPLYREALRPQLHVTARQWAMHRTNPVERQEGWLNDLNGLVLHDGEYHLFAQRWNTCWIHAVSSDLVRWTELPPAFFEEGLGTGVQSGSCVVDHENTSGLGDGVTAPMIAFWSRNDNRSQCLSYSVDHGRTWTHFEGNPVLDMPERDPMVFWDHARSRWAMVLYGEDRYHLLTSANLLEWKATGGTVENSFECPDLFELRVDGGEETRWVLVRGDGRYSIGRFDGNDFVEETDQLHNDVGSSFYATQSWAAGRERAPRRVQAAWMRGGKYPQMPFNQQVSLPCELTLRSTPHGLRVHREPIRELEDLVREQWSWPARTLAAGASWEVGVSRPLQRVRAELDLAPDAHLEMDLNGSVVQISAVEVRLGGDVFNSPDPITSIDAIVDLTSIELFVNEGLTSITRCAHAAQPRIVLRSREGIATIGGLRVQELSSIWEPAPTG